jgi:hypothetical protein
MNVHRLRRPGAKPVIALVLVLGAAALGGCGTPAVVKPAATPLPGLQHDIQAAQNAVTQSQQPYGSTTIPTQ